MYTVQAERPFAVDSPDHNQPWGAWHDNNTHSGFVWELERAGVKSVLDLGCAHGTFVRDCSRFANAFGLDGCGWLPANSKNWKELPHLYGSADLSRRWLVTEVPNHCATFDLITSWEVLEHIPEASVPLFLECVSEHMNPHRGSLFVGTVSLVPDKHNGHDYHQTVQPWEWWQEQFAAAGLALTGYPFRYGVRNEVFSERFALRLK